MEGSRGCGSSREEGFLRPSGTAIRAVSLIIHTRESVAPSFPWLAGRSLLCTLHVGICVPAGGAVSEFRAGYVEDSGPLGCWRMEYFEFRVDDAVSCLTRFCSWCSVDC